MIGCVWGYGMDDWVCGVWDIGWMIVCVCVGYGDIGWMIGCVCGMGIYDG